MIDITTSFDVPINHPCFAAHFPGNPIVPGALLISWIILQLEQTITNQTLVGIKNIKFLQAVHPGEPCIIHANNKNSNRQLNIQCTIAKTIVCKGILLLQS